MSKAEFYSFSRKKLVVMGIAIFICQVSLFGAGYLLSTVLRPEPILTAANGQPCSVPGASASTQPAPASTQTAPATSGPANTQATVAHEEQKANAEVASVTGAPAKEVAGTERGLQKQVASELAPAAAVQPIAAAARATGTAPSAAANKPASAPAGASGADAPASAEAAAAAARPANPRVAAVACESAPDLMNPEASPAEAHKYAVQIGAFLDANNALRLASEFKAKGYQPCLMKAADKQGRRWTVVRMGAFEDVSKASLYARSISGREQTVALVRPADSF